MNKYGISEAKTSIGFSVKAVPDAAVSTLERTTGRFVVRAGVVVTAFALVFTALTPVMNYEVANANHDPFGGVIQDHVMLCHSGNGKNYTDNSPSVSGTGANVNLAGHEGHDNDIIPPFHYAGGVYNGKNWTEANEDIWNGDGKGNGLCTSSASLSKLPGRPTKIENLHPPMTQTVTKKKKKKKKRLG